MEEQVAKKSKYNSAVNQLLRLGNLWSVAQSAATKGKMMAWNWTLDAIWRELAGDVKPGSDEEKHYESFKVLIVKNKSNKGMLYSILEKKHLWLKRLENGQGKGTAYFDMDEYELEE